MYPSLVTHELPSSTLVAGTYKKERVLLVSRTSLASGGGFRRYSAPGQIWLRTGFTVCDWTVGRMHSDAQFAGSSSVPAHVEMMGFLGIGNNPDGRMYSGFCG